jgi:DMSO/TMAO reductase YedYZ molybdopterin-dependent catalytic subunit
VTSKRGRGRRGVRGQQLPAGHPVLPGSGRTDGTPGPTAASRPRRRPGRADAPGPRTRPRPRATARRAAVLVLLAATVAGLAVRAAASGAAALARGALGLIDRAVGLADRAAAPLERLTGLLSHPRELTELALRHPPPGPFRPGFWRSPLRGQWLTSVLGLVLLGGLSIQAITGLLSYAAYDPRLAGNDETPGAGLLHFYLFSWPAGPASLYRVNQGIHVELGIALVPIVLAKLWSVLPKLFSWPPAASPAEVLERLSLVMLVGGVLFEFATGILNIQNYYVFPFSFYTAHLYGAWVFIAGFVIHVILKFPHMRAGLRSRSLRRELRTPLAATVPEEPDRHGLRAASPAAPTVSRRGLLAGVAGGSLTLVVLAAGQSIGGWTRRTALFAPRGLSAANSGTPPVNRTAATIGLTAADVGPAYRLVLAGARQVSLTREQLAALPQHTAVLPIACVEGWSVAGSWTGVRLTDLARLAGITRPGEARVESLERHGSFRTAALSAAQVTDSRSMLALGLNGADLSWDHGYPARTIIPAAPGVHNTKWVNKIIFTERA